MTTQFPAGPKSALLGLDFINRFRSDPLGVALSLRRDFGDVAYIKLGPYNWYMFNHPDQVKDVLVTRAKQFGKTDQFKKIIRSVDGNGLVASEGDFWLKQRRIIQPAFSHHMLDEYAEVMSAEVTNFISRWQPGMELNLSDEMTNITLILAAKIFLDTEVEGRAEELAEAVTAVSKAMYREFTEVLPLPDWFPIPGKLQKRKAISTLDRLIHQAIERHQQAPSTRRSVMAMLIAARDTDGSGLAMSKEQVRNEAITMFNAGHDSTAAALAWTWLLLLKHKESYRRLLADVDSSGSEPMPKAPYLACVAKEALRLYPPAWIIPRQCLEDVELAGYRLSRGSLVNLFPFVIQRDERFFEDPESFRPERFSAENEQRLHPFAFFPFGAGPRSCIGRDFALMDMQLILTTISQHFELELCPGCDDIAPNPLVSLEPGSGVRAIVKVRRSNDRDAQIMRSENA